MKLFTIITGIITIVSFAASIEGLIPEYSMYLNNISYILLGLVAGNVIGLFDKAKFEIYRFKSSHVFVYAFYVAIAVVTLVLIMTKEGLEIKVLGSIGTFIVITLFFLKPLLDEQGVTITERMILSDIHKEKGNYSQAIWHLALAKDGMSSEDSRKELLDKKIATLKEKQVLGAELKVDL